MTVSLADLPLAVVRQALAAGEVSAAELTDAALTRADRFTDFQLFITPLAERARSAAAAVDRALAEGIAPGALHGVPITVKDNIDMAGLPTTVGSPAFADRVAEVDAPVVARAEAAGAVVLGKTNLHEMAFGGTCVNPFHGTVPNPWRPALVSGGSSGGSAACVALGVGFASLGTDAAGSVRIPASCCGLVGLKPTHGLISQRGVVPTSTEHIDHVGVLVRSVADARAMLDVLAGPDPDDPHSSPHRPEPAPPLADLRGVRVGVPEGWFWTDLDAPVETVALATLDLMAGAGAELVPARMDIADLVPLLRVAMFAEAYVFHQPALDAHPEHYSPGLRHRLMAGQYVLAQDYIRALRARRLVIEAMRDALTAVDVLAMPTLPVLPPTIAEATDVTGSRAVAALSRNTAVVNQSGHPALSLPMGLADQTPVGFQLVGQAHGDHALLAVAEVVEHLVGFDLIPPGLRRPTPAPTA